MVDVRGAEAARHPLVLAHAPEWASGWGEDEHGVFVEITVGEVTQLLRFCPPGRFMMGSPTGEVERHSDEGPQTEVVFAAGFWLFDTPVTQALYETVTGENPAQWKGADRPVENVSWNAAQSFLNAVNGAHPGLHLRLPSEAEWEYACRARSTTPFEPNVAFTHLGASITPEEVNYDGNFPYMRAEKGRFLRQTVGVKDRPFRPNGWGLWHMHGNVYEWCEDDWQDSHESALSDGQPRTSSRQTGSTDRVIRGGSWFGIAGTCRAAYRRRIAPGVQLDDLGFRPARGQAAGAQARAAEPPDAS